MSDHTLYTFKHLPGRTVPASRKAQADRSSADAAELHRFVEQLSGWMDSAFQVPGVGWRFGWDALIGLLPGVGDAATTLVALYIVTMAAKLGVPRITIARMGLNVAIDMVMGSLPLVGDFFDVYWKANLRNAALLRQRLADTPAGTRRASAGDWIFVTALLIGLCVLFISLLALVAFAVGALWNLAIR